MNIVTSTAAVIRKAALPLKTRLFWVAIYFGFGLLFAGIAYGETVRYEDCRVINSIFNLRPAEGIIVATLFWPAMQRPRNRPGFA